MGIETRPTRASDVDVVNVVASFMVVFLHVRIMYWKPQDVPAWWFENVLSGLGVMAVPLFLMNTGRNLIGFLDRESVATYLRKRFTKVLVPYLLWTQVYLVFHWAMGWVSDMGLPRMLHAVYNGAAVAPTLWYLEAIMGIYLVIPVLALVRLGAEARGMSLSRVFGWMSVLALVSVTLLPLLRVVVPSFMPSLSLPFGGYLVYVLVGYWVSVTRLSRGQRWVLYLCGVAGMLSFVVLGGTLMLAGSDAAKLWTGYLSPGPIAATTALYVAIGRLQWQRWSRRVKSALKDLAGLTFGVYLLHLMLVELVDVWMPSRSVRWDLPISLGVWLCALGIVWVVRCVPLARRWLVP